MPEKTWPFKLCFAMPEANILQNSIFSMERLTFAYKKGEIAREVLSNTTFSLFPGQNIGLIGHNGIGKTTLFRCITGLLRPQTGTIRLGAQVMENEKDFQKLRMQVGLVLQDADDQLFFPTVIEDLAFGPLNLGLDEKKARQRARYALELVGLRGFEQRLTHELSGGEKKLVAIAAMLAMKPRALLLDEPLNGLDGNARKRLEQILAALDCAKIVISHDLAFLDRTCANIMEIKNKKLAPCQSAS